jgi:hypothetical protein
MSDDQHNSLWHVDQGERIQARHLAYLQFVHDVGGTLYMGEAREPLFVAEINRHKQQIVVADKNGTTFVWQYRGIIEDLATPQHVRDAYALLLQKLRRMLQDPTITRMVNAKLEKLRQDGLREDTRDMAAVIEAMEKLEAEYKARGEEPPKQFEFTLEK